MISQPTMDMPVTALKRELDEDPWGSLINYAQRNLENSDRYGESLTAFCRGFKPDYSRYFVPQTMIPFYGTEIWDELNEDQRIFLSQVRYAAIYNRVSSLENLACESNSLFAAQLQKNSSNVLRFYVNRETQEEYDHIWSFRQTSRAIELHHFGEPVFDVPGANFDAQVNIKLFNRIRTAFRFMPKIMVMVTYTIRGLRNAALKTTEEAILQATDMEPNLQKQTRLHFIDEARHTGMSYMVGKSMYEISGRSPLCNLLILQYLKRPQEGGPQSIKKRSYSEPDVRNPVVRPRLLAHPILKSKAERINRFLDSGLAATPIGEDLYSRYLQRCNKNLEYMPEDFRNKANELLLALRTA